MRSTRTRLGAAITAGVALSAIGVLSMTSGTVAELSDSISVRANVGVDGKPYGIARTVSLGYEYVRADGKRDNRVKSATLTSLSDSRNDAPVDDKKPWTFTNSQFRLDRLSNDRGCTSSNLNNNTSRCPNTSPGSLVSASTGKEPGASKFDVDFRDMNLGGTLNHRTFLRIHDIDTSVSCDQEGNVSAGAPFANYWAGSEGDGGNKNSDWIPTAGDNRFSRTRQWLRSTVNQNQALTVEVQTIRQTFANPPRALSAVVVFATSSNARNGGGEVGNLAFVSKSECAVSPDGSVSLDPSTTFGELLPATRTLETPGWNDNYTKTIGGDLGAARTADFGPADAMRSLVAAGADDTMALTEPATSSTTTSTRASATTPSSATTTRSSAPSATHSSERPSTTEASATPQRGFTTATVADPSLPETTTESITQRSFRRADNEALSKPQKELVEEAIDAAVTADAGNLSGGASYAVTANQLDGTTLIVRTASGGTLRIVWEK